MFIIKKTNWDIEQINKFTQDGLEVVQKFSLMHTAHTQQVSL